MGADDTGNWSARFDGPINKLMESFNASIDFDRRMLKEELAASAAHARMLGMQGIISEQDCDAILSGLGRLAEQERSGSFAWTQADEDVHTAVERRLTEDIGDAGKRLHTARSRNDQVATVTRMWLRERMDEQMTMLAKARVALLRQAERHLETVMPGFTHLQVAQPTTLAHHLHAHSCMFKRDSERLAQCRDRLNTLPLGAGALAGTSFPISPADVAKELGFDRLCENSMDAVSDRDFAIDYLGAASTIMVHLSRACEEIVIWCSQPFSFARVSDSFSTGSSIMPQKRNPDAAELIRGKAGRVIGHLVGLLGTVKAQPLAYNKDNQEDKEALFDASDTVEACLSVFALMVESLRFDEKAMDTALAKGYATATELADLLVRKGVPFRDAHAKVAETVNAAETQGVSLSGLSDEDLGRITGIDPVLARSSLDPTEAVRARKSPGGPSPTVMEAAIRVDLEAAEKAT